MAKFCFRHPDVEAVTVCNASTCDRPLCPDCMVYRDGTIFCSEECALKQAALGEELRKKLKEKHGGSIFWTLFKLAVIGAIILGFLEFIEVTDFLTFI